ncbi:MAG: DNA-binding protein [Candidatus Heimdallarchaeota archaeon]|nr:DNA-binding protein [Candidatus Heimdallarchaeota archaeon]MDH5646174.1 DNA-binding protein [Candidatus Heimdallarchaeota archaeon]
MEYSRHKDTIFLRLDKEDPIIESITKLIVDENIQAGYFNGLGATKQVVLRFLNQKTREFEEKEFTEYMEIASLHGNITKFNGKPYIHAHIVLGTSNYGSYSGHLQEGIIGATAEIIINCVDMDIDRQYDSETNLNLLKFIPV